MYAYGLKHGDVNTYVRYLRGEIDLERERIGLRIGERVRLRGIGDLLGGLRTRLGELQMKLVLKGKRKRVCSDTNIQIYKDRRYYNSMNALAFEIHLDMNYFCNLVFRHWHIEPFTYP